MNQGRRGRGRGRGGNHGQHHHQHEGSPLRGGRGGRRGNRGGRGGRGGGGHPDYRREAEEGLARPLRGGLRGGGYRGGRGGRGGRHHDGDEYVTPAPTHRGFCFSIKYLEGLLDKSPRQVTTALATKREDFSGFLSQGKTMDDRLFRLIVKVIALGCESSANQSVLDMLNCALSSTFLTRQVSSHLIKLANNESFNAEIETETIDNIVKILDGIVDRFPSRAAELSIADTLKTVVVTHLSDENDLIERVDDLLKERQEAVRKDAARGAATAAGVAASPSDHLGITMQDPEDDFTEIKVAPQSDEIAFNDQPFLRPNIRRGAFRDLKQYLDIQFRLLREDFVGPLREGIAALDDMDRRKLKPTDLRVYRRVHVREPICTLRGLTHRLQFDVSRMQRVRWRYTRRLIFGSLLCLSSDNFRTIKLAVVANRSPEDLEQGFVDVRFENGLADLADIRPDSEFTMAESPAYYEAYRHVLDRLQSIKDDLPFQQYIVECRFSEEVPPPRYLRAEHRADATVPTLNLRRSLGCRNIRARAVPATNTDAWPLTEDVDLDESQYGALKMALTKEFALIQGPPGTGKTYVGLKVMEALIENRRVWSPEGAPHSPILVVCYTNHALDQFLEGILEFLPDGIVRVGGRSNSEKLKNFNLAARTRRLRSHREVPVAIHFGRRQTFHEVMDLQKDIEASLEKLAKGKKSVVGISSFTGIDGCELIRALSGYGHLFETRGYSLLDEWLGIVCQIETAESEQKGDGSFAETAQKEGNGQEIASDESDSEEGEAEIDEEAERLEAERRIEGQDYERIEGREERLPQGETGQNEGAAAAVAAANAPNDEEGGWMIQGMSKGQRHHKIQRLRVLRPMTDDEVNGIDEDNLWQLDENSRWRLYNYWMEKRRAHFKLQSDNLCRSFEEACNRYKEQTEQEDLHILRMATVIGMTTTGAAKYRSLLQEIRPRIVVVEEAAEVYEAHIVTTLSPATEHLILIGDHQQLRPSPHVFRLARKYDLDVSMFERMVNNRMPCRRLNTQHRMRPEIRRLMNHIYDDLHDHESVLTYGNVPGVKHNMFFLEHKAKESENEDLRSHLNRHEAEIAAALCRYLIQQGIEGSKITVLTTYTGQVLVLKEKMPKGLFAGVRITVVDNYQGEENDIIILSLVRSNENKKIGFLNISNRVCVALSRAKRGFYCIGNMTLLADQSDLWKKIFADMKTQGVVGKELELCCQNHPETAIKVSRGADFNKAPEGGCLKQCEFRLSCGHVCSLSCHPYDPDHKESKCRKDCTRKCPRGHPCTKKCFKPCGDCAVNVPRRLPQCGHVQPVPCFQEPVHIRCREPCPKPLSCGHPCTRHCGDSYCLDMCQVLVSKTFPCGHEENVKCCNRYENTPCPEPCTELLQCGHQCIGTCGECHNGKVHKQCGSRCGRTLVCSHECLYPCTKNCPPCSVNCENRCNHSKCGRKCGQLCQPCKEPCEWVCKHHTCAKLCSEPCERPRCDHPCNKRLWCGHRCIGLCGERCPQMCRVCDRTEVTEIFFGTEEEPNARFIELEDCRHIFEVSGLDTWMDQEEKAGEEEANGEASHIHIGLKECPRCKTAVRRSLRYGNVVKRALHDIEAVKTRVIEQSKEMQRRQKQIKRHAVALMLKLSKSSLFSETINADVVRHLQRNVLNLEEVEEAVLLLDGSPCGVILKRIRGRPTSEVLWTAENQVLLLSKLVDVNKKIQKARDSQLMIRKCAELTEQLKACIGDTMVAELNHDALVALQTRIQRVELSFNFNLVQYEVQSTGRSLSDEDKGFLLRIERLLRQTNLSVEDLETIRKAIKKVAESCGSLGISDAERIQIVQAMGLKKGHWYKCPKGHVYAIGDCGGANEGGKCPTCKAAIGGQNHGLAPGNQLAPEMDGAKYAAWSDEANMAFDPRQFMT
eukprot:m.12348 g.12348  ORF g.12348 m.12348 type:complete len:1904 (+) comp23991_c0_seq1:48-5759(+)